MTRIALTAATVAALFLLGWDLVRWIATGEFPWDRMT